MLDILENKWVLLTITILLILSLSYVVFYQISKISTQPSLILLYPNGGEEIEVGSIVNIKWKTKNIAPENKISITIRKNNINENIEGQEFDPILFINLDNDGNEDWLVSDMFKTGDYILEINSYESLPITNSISDESNNAFNILNQGVGLANPASQNCIEKGGTLSIQERGDGGQYGICFFEDNRQCEEWALFNGECPIGGLKVTGYITPAAVYCAITGGTYTITNNSNTDNEQGRCKKNDKECDVWDLWNGKCDL